VADLCCGRMSTNHEESLYRRLLSGLMGDRAEKPSSLYSPHRLHEDLSSSSSSMRYEDSPLLKMKGRQMQNTQSSNFYALKESVRFNQSVEEVAFDFLSRLNFKSLPPLSSDSSTGDDASIYAFMGRTMAFLPVICLLHCNPEQLQQLFHDWLNLLSSSPAVGLVLDRVPLRTRRVILMGLSRKQQFLVKSHAVGPLLLERLQIEVFLSSSQDPALAASSLTPVAPPPAAASQNSSGLRNKDLLARIRRSFNARSLPHTERKSTPARTAQGCSVAASTAVRSPIALSISGTSSTAQSAPAAPPPALAIYQRSAKQPRLTHGGSQVFSPL